MPPGIKVTSEMLWQGTLIFALIDLGAIPLLVWRIQPSRFRRLKWTLVVTAAIFWGLLWTWVLASFWDSVYHYLFPAWARPFLPFFFGLLSAAVALGLWWGATRLSINPILGFCLFGGLWGMVTHLWAVYRGIVNKPPMLQGASPAAAVIIAIFEFIFYWCVILGLAALWDYGWQRVEKSLGVRGQNAVRR